MLHLRSTSGKQGQNCQRHFSEQHSSRLLMLSKTTTDFQGSNNITFEMCTRLPLR